MKKILLSAVAAIALISAPAIAGGKHHDRGHGYNKEQSYKDHGHRDYGKRHGKRDWGKHHRGKRHGKRGYGHRGHGYHHDYEKPEPTPEPEPKPSAKPDRDPVTPTGIPQDTDENTQFSYFMGYGHPTANDAQVLSKVFHGAISPFDIEPTCPGGCWQVKPEAYERPFSEWRVLVW